jgi:hypothetical protein
MQVTLADTRVLTLPDLHVAVQGVPNSGKTRFAASAETPMLVLAADPLDKLQAYFDRGVRDPQQYTGQFGQPIWLVRSRTTGKPIIQIEGYYDEDMKNPQAMNQLLSRLPQISEEVKAKRWRTVVIDSWTQLEWIARQRRTEGVFADVDSVYGAAKDDLQGIVNSRLMNLRCNLILTFHIETKVVKDKKGNIIKDARTDLGGGELSYSIQAIGTLKNIANVLGETYLAVAPVDGSDNYVLVTKRNADFRQLCSRINAPNPVTNDWRALFTNWIADHAADATTPGESLPQPAPAADTAAAQQETVQS